MNSGSEGNLFDGDENIGFKTKRMNVKRNYICCFHLYILLGKWLGMEPINGQFEDILVDTKL